VPGYWHWGGHEYTRYSGHWSLRRDAAYYYRPRWVVTGGHWGYHVDRWDTVPRREWYVTRRSYRVSWTREHGGVRPPHVSFRVDVHAGHDGRGDVHAGHGDVHADHDGRGDVHSGHDQGRGDQGRGDQGRGDQGRGDQGRGDQGRGDQGRGSGQGQGRGDQGSHSSGQPATRVAPPNKGATRNEHR
jgi:hypothetical protein